MKKCQCLGLVVLLGGIFFGFRFNTFAMTEYGIIDELNEMRPDLKSTITPVQNVQSEDFIGLARIVIQPNRELLLSAKNDTRDGIDKSRFKMLQDIAEEEKLPYSYEKRYERICPAVLVGPRTAAISYDCLNFTALNTPIKSFVLVPEESYFVIEGNDLTTYSNSIRTITVGPMKEDANFWLVNNVWPQRYALLHFENPFLGKGGGHDFFTELPFAQLFSSDSQELYKSHIQVDTGESRERMINFSIYTFSRESVQYFENGKNALNLYHSQIRAKETGLNSVFKRESRSTEDVFYESDQLVKMDKRFSEHSLDVAMVGSPVFSKYQKNLFLGFANKQDKNEENSSALEIRLFSDFDQNWFAHHRTIKNISVDVSKVEDRFWANEDLWSDALSKLAPLEQAANKVLKTIDKDIASQFGIENIIGGFDQKGDFVQGYKQISWENFIDELSGQFFAVDVSEAIDTKIEKLNKQTSDDLVAVPTKIAHHWFDVTLDGKAGKGNVAVLNDLLLYRLTVLPNAQLTIQSDSIIPENEYNKILKKNAANKTYIADVRKRSRLLLNEDSLSDKKDEKKKDDDEDFATFQKRLTTELKETKELYDFLSAPDIDENLKRLLLSEKELIKDPKIDPTHIAANFYLLKPKVESLQVYNKGGILLVNGILKVFNQFTVSDEGILAGFGEVQMSSINPLVNESGKIKPGYLEAESNGQNASPGVLTINGDYHHKKGANLELSVFGGIGGHFSSDRLKVIGRMTIEGGSLEIGQFVDTYGFDPCRDLTIVEATEIKGQFEEIIVPPGLNVELEYKRDSIRLRFTGHRYQCRRIFTLAENRAGFFDASAHNRYSRYQSEIIPEMSSMVLGINNQIFELNRTMTLSQGSATLLAGGVLAGYGRLNLGEDRNLQNKSGNLVPGAIHQTMQGLAAEDLALINQFGYNNQKPSWLYLLGQGTEGMEEIAWNNPESHRSAQYIFHLDGNYVQSENAKTTIKAYQAVNSSDSCILPKVEINGKALFDRSKIYVDLSNCSSFLQGLAGREMTLFSATGGLFGEVEVYAGTSGKDVSPWDYKLVSTKNTIKIVLQDHHVDSSEDSDDKSVGKPLVLQTFKNQIEMTHDPILPGYDMSVFDSQKREDFVRIHGILDSLYNDCHMVVSSFHDAIRDRYGVVLVKGDYEQKEHADLTLKISKEVFLDPKANAKKIRDARDKIRESLMHNGVSEDRYNKDALEKLKLIQQKLVEIELTGYLESLDERIRETLKDFEGYKRKLAEIVVEKLKRDHDIIHISEKIVKQRLVSFIADLQVNIEKLGRKFLENLFNDRSLNRNIVDQLLVRGTAYLNGRLNVLVSGAIFDGLSGHSGSAAGMVDASALLAVHDGAKFTLVEAEEIVGTFQSVKVYGLPEETFLDYKLNYRTIERGGKKKQVLEIEFSENAERKADFLAKIEDVKLREEFELLAPKKGGKSIANKLFQTAPNFMVGRIQASQRMAAVMSLRKSIADEFAGDDGINAQFKAYTDNDPWSEVLLEIVKDKFDDASTTHVNKMINQVIEEQKASEKEDEDFVQMLKRVVSDFAENKIDTRLIGELLKVQYTLVKEEVGDFDESDAASDKAHERRTSYLQRKITFEVSCETYLIDVINSMYEYFKSEKKADDRKKWQDALDKYAERCKKLLRASSEEILQETERLKEEKSA